MVGDKTSIKKSNRLINEKSPYLLQHAYNPVDWFSWGDEAFNKAKKENKPIFLSIGYSTCHWCHVMEKESFEDEEVAHLLNSDFVSIKVDREERPDIDNVYMTICQMTTGSGGWPLTVFLTPDRKPFFAGTYFPKQSAYGRIGVIDLLSQIKQIWTDKKEDVTNSADQMTELLQKVSNVMPGESLNEEIMKSAFNDLQERFDSTYGGFGSAPKFPTPHNLNFLLRWWKRTGDKKALNIVEKTLRSMRCGGIFDHIGFGFHRYSTDSRWLVPHFEKMLYDQALLAMAYIETYLVTKNDFYKTVAEEIFEYVNRDMTDKEGGFYSAEDADSEGEEGKFYLWNYDELCKVLTKEEADLIIKAFNVEKEGNFLEEAIKRKIGANILHLKDILSEVKDLENIRQKLFSVREKRIHPHKDDKVLTSWNGLMISALARGVQAFGNEQYTVSAKCAADFILEKMIVNGKLLHRYRERDAKISAYLDDYAFFVSGLLDLYETTFEIKYLKAALDLNEYAVKHFWDEQNGGFYFALSSADDLIVRQKEIYDGAIPSGNSIAMLNLLRISKITDNQDFKEKAIKLIEAFSSSIKMSPLAHTQFLVALDYLIGPSYEIIVVGNSNTEILEVVKKTFLPNKVLIFKPDDKSSEITQIAKFTENYKSIDGSPTAYICKNYNCNLPVTKVDEVIKLISSL